MVGEDVAVDTGVLLPVPVELDEGAAEFVLVPVEMLEYVPVAEKCVPVPVTFGVMVQDAERDTLQLLEREAVVVREGYKTVASHSGNPSGLTLYCSMMPVQTVPPPASSNCNVAPID